MPVSPRAQGYTAVQDETEGDHLGGDKPEGDDREAKKKNGDSKPGLLFLTEVSTKALFGRRPASDHRASQ